VAKLQLKGDEKTGAGILATALEAPLRQLAQNAGSPVDVVAEKVRAGKGAEGYDVVASRYTDLQKAGICDPAKVVKSALTNAVSTAVMLLTTEASITIIPEKKKGAPMPQEPYGEGMY
jgi:chaperonin GroEL